MSSRSVRLQRGHTRGCFALETCRRSGSRASADGECNLFDSNLVPVADTRFCILTSRLAQLVGSRQLSRQNIAYNPHESSMCCRITSRSLSKHIKAIMRSRIQKSLSTLLGWLLAIGGSWQQDANQDKLIMSFPHRKRAGFSEHWTNASAPRHSRAAGWLMDNLG